MKTMKDVGEYGLHAWLQEVVPLDGFELPMGDDAATLWVADGYDVLVSTDRVPSYLTGRYAGRYAVTQNFSDVICKGGQPIGFLLAVLLNRNTQLRDYQDLITAAAAEAKEYGAALIGGDTKEARANTIVGTAIATVKRGGAISRAGANPGDIVAVTMKNGWRLGWRWARHVRDYFGLSVPRCFSETLDEYYETRLKVGYAEMMAAVGTNAITASMDITDGLGGALQTISNMSHVGFIISEDRTLELVDPALALVCEALGIPPIKFAWSPGYDWENLLTVKAEEFQSVKRAVNSVGGELLDIGRVSEGKDILVETGVGIKRLNPLTSEVFTSHLRSSQPRFWARHKDYLDY